MLETITKIKRNQFWKKNILLLVETIVLIFLLEEAVFPYRGNVFFNKSFIRSSGNGFLG